MNSQGDKPNDKGIYDINIITNKVFNRVTIMATSKYIVQLPEKGFNEILGFTKTLIIGPNKEINGDIVQDVERVESVFVHCNLVDNRYQLESSIIYKFTPDKSQGRLLHIRPFFQGWRRAQKNSEFNEIKIRFTDQCNRELELDDPKVTIELQIKNAKQ